jgi:sodium/pantothenate symporter
MEIVIIAALIVSIIFFLSLGFKYGRKNKTLSDIFPVLFGKNAKIDNTEEFSSSTIATTVSLATIIMAYFQMAGYFGLYLLWTTITSVIGMYLLSKLSKRILAKISIYNHRPTLHEFLGTEYNNKSIIFVSAVCTSLGFLLIAALELIVGSLFLAELIPSIPQTVTAIILSATGVIYLSVGGYKTVIRSDVWQMKFIWLLIAALFIYFIYDLATNNFSINSFNNIPKSIYDFSNRPGLWMFLVGITIMNIPTHLSNQAMFQRINSSENPDTVIKGLRNSTTGIFWSWTLIVLIACLAYMFVPKAPPELLLPDLLKHIGQTIFGKIILFVVVIGMYSALLSTASTNLMVIGHTFSEDLWAKFGSRTLQERDSSKKEFNRSRLILLFASLFSVFIVEILKKIGFDVKDLVFSIYGGSLALFPPILFALFSNRFRLRQLSSFATAGIILGFLVGWGIAFYGKFSNNGDLIFLSPAFSIGISSICLLIGYLVIKPKLVS